MNFNLVISHDGYPSTALAKITKDIPQFLNYFIHKTINILRFYKKHDIILVSFSDTFNMWNYQGLLNTWQFQCSIFVKLVVENHRTLRCFKMKFLYLNPFRCIIGLSFSFFWYLSLRTLITSLRCSFLLNC